MSGSDLVADLAKKSGLVWVGFAGRDHAVWHEWVGDAVCVVSGGGEQDLAGIEQHDVVTLRLRSRSTRALAATVDARVDVVAPGSEHWAAVTGALKAGRLNLADADGAVDRWAAQSVVVRLVPEGFVATPARIPTDIGYTAPRLTS